MLSDNMVVTGKRALVCSNAKINFTLDVLKKREDGYHDVKMIMQTVSLFDLVIVDRARKNITVTTNLSYIPDNEQNIAYKAAKTFLEYTHIFSGCKILIRKNIPIAAGLAGGSGNAAAVLCALDRLYDTNLSEDELCGIGATLGADVPFCIKGGTMLAEGIGERLRPLPSFPKCPILLVKPTANVSTSEIYKSLDDEKIEIHPNTEEFIDALIEENIPRIASLMYNVMEPVTAGLHPEIKEIQEAMKKHGALGAVMSGSGPTVLGIFPDYSTAKAAHNFFTRRYKSVFIVSPI